MAVQEIIELKKNGIFTFEKKLEYKLSGRPKPYLKLVQTTNDRGKEVNRYFKDSMYDICDWICGCDTRDAFFCFPCLFFGEDTLWTKTGVKDIKHLKVKIKQHDGSTVHINSSVSFESLGCVDIKTQLDSAYRNSLREYNEKVSKNRYIVNKLIDCVKFCGIFELAMRGHDETQSSDNPGVFQGLISFVSELDVVFKNHIESTSDFESIANTIQNEILDSMLAIIHQTINNEIEQSNYLAIVADETMDASNKSQIVFLVRYVFKGKIHERFWRLLNPPGMTGKDLTNAILEELKILKIDKNPDKLIAQSYDRAAVTSGKLGGVQVKIKQVYPEANFIHCYAHQLDLILQKAVTQHRQIKIFFANLHAFTSFFSKSPKHTDVLDKMVKARMPKATLNGWYFNSKCIETVYTYKIDLINCLEIIVNTEQNDNSINQAQALLSYLQNENFVHWLEFFHSIMYFVDILFNQLQKRDIDISSVKTFISEFNNNIQEVRNSQLNSPIESTIVKLEDQCTVINTPSTSKKRICDVDNTDMKHSITIEICDIILSEIRYRFGYIDHLIVVQLFDVNKFPIYKQTFPEDVLQIVKKTYSKIDVSKLKSELIVIYSREDFQYSAGALAILQLFLNMNLSKTFSESVKLLEIICTMPLITVESKRCFSTLKRIKTFLQNTMSQSRLTSLAMLSIERSFVMSVENFNEQVINHFANQKERTIDLMFK